MDYVLIGRTGLRVSRVCLGTMTFGKESDEAVSRAIMDYAWDLGVNFFDTANVYNKGLTEEICMSSMFVCDRPLLPDFSILYAPSTRLRPSAGR